MQLRRKVGRWREPWQRSAKRNSSPISEHNDCCQSRIPWTVIVHELSTPILSRFAEMQRYLPFLVNLMISMLPSESIIFLIYSSLIVIGEDY